MKVIRFTQKVAPYNPGEVAGFEDELANAYIANGFAEFEPDAPANTPAKVTNPLTGENVSGNPTVFSGHIGHDPRQTAPNPIKVPDSREPMSGLQVPFEYSRTQAVSGNNADGTAANAPSDEEQEQAVKGTNKNANPELPRREGVTGAPNDKAVTGDDRDKGNQPVRK